MPGSEDRLDGFEVQWRATAVNEGLKHLVHVPADLEDQVSTVFDLIVGVLITEPAALLLVEVEGEAHTAVNPTLADLAQSPYSPLFGQGAHFGVSDRRFRFKPAGGFGGNRQAVSVQSGTPLRMGFGPDFGEPPLRDTSYLALVCQSKYSCHYY